MPTDPHPAPNDNPLRSVHTRSLPDLMLQLGISLVVSTYQAGKMILIRADGESLNTHFVNFDKPMGITADRDRLTIGGARTVWYYRNMPGVAVQADPRARHDACYLPRAIHVTGDIDIHELAWGADDELWIVNTRFSCLCTLDRDSSFVPRWRPPFVTALAPEDRCHLNGLAMVDRAPRYISALGRSDDEAGWRPDKARGGVLMDIDSNEIVLAGLSMPHSPRWYQDRLWILESGVGGLASVDLERGTWQTVAGLPGFTRGIDFAGPLAFIGLSQVRESAVFSGIPLVRDHAPRYCGVWVVNIETGDTLGFVRFEEGVQEIFAVQVLEDTRSPMVLDWDDPALSRSYMLPEDTLGQVSLPTAEEQRRQPGYLLQEGVRHFQRGEFDHAVSAFEACLAINPDYPNARYNLGVALGDACRYVEAARVLCQVIGDEPERAEARNSLGYVLNRQGLTAAAIGQYEAAIALQPDYAQAHFNLGIALLESCDYPRGFEEYEWRWRTPRFTPFRSPHPQWGGEPIPDKTLLVHTEQGAGDVIQFARFIPRAATLCKRLVLVAPPELFALLATVPGIAELRESGAIPVDDFDVFVPMMSLARHLGVTADTVPADVPYFDIEAIRRRASAKVPPLPETGGLRVGIVWAGSPTHVNDTHRSCRAGDFLPLQDVRGVTLFSLQVGPQAGQLEEDDCRGIRDACSGIGDWGDTALLIDQLDLVVSVDTAVAHLAGALGKSVWLLPGAHPDWRWALGEQGSPWYPTMRLFRQSLPGDWRSVMQDVARALGQFQS